MGANVSLFWTRQPKPPKPPRGTERATLTPSQVQVGHYVLLSGVYRQIRSMTALTGGGRLLHFEGRGPYAMRVAMQIYRPR
ncbi:hypothetical protein [Streptomyces parvus]|uniref:Uncharacterized protein n=1 Tax=Streptomyces parvus TaxID=66428 RepID=A0A7K3S2Q1_9ACTN|nr:hypothetical protein [Streptomyces parvus]NEC21212.1 hypothetical protein [Streptomyces parvus]NEE27004.1 hypothetical protein [Streptomyces sp. SID7982]